jgi:WD40 repeat protein
VTQQVPDADYFFDDRAPDGFHEYHLRRLGGLQLFRDGKPIKEVVGPRLRGKTKPFENRVLELLEFFLQNPGRHLSRKADLAHRFAGSIAHHLMWLRQLLSDEVPPHRLIQNVGMGDVQFVVPVRNAPSAYHSVYRAEIKQHWKPSAMGSGTLFHEGRWFFSGREAVLQNIVEWLSAPTSGAVARVVMGDPGAGKSAILGFLVTCASAEERLVPELTEFLNRVPAATVPVHAGIDFAINLRDRTLQDVQELLASRFHLEAADAVNSLCRRQDRTALVFDSLEESADPISIAREIRKLIGSQHIWILVGARRAEVERLGDAIAVLDLSSNEFRSDADVERYVESLLLAEGDYSFLSDPDNARSCARNVARGAQGNFLVAFILARALVEQHRRRPIARRNSDGEPLRTPQDAFEEYLLRLGERSGLGYARLLRAFMPLAYAQGGGIPREVWGRLTEVDTEALLHLAKAFISESYEDGQLVFRFYHQALAEVLRRPGHELDEQGSIARRLLDAIPNKDWRRADRYTLKYLPRHAAEGGILDRLLLDNEFLVTADPDILLQVLGAASSPQAKRIATCYRLAAGRLKLSNINERANYLELIALQNGALDLAPGVAAERFGDWRARWACWTASTPHLALHGEFEPVHALAISEDAFAYCDQAGAAVARDLRSGRVVSRWEFDRVVAQIAIHEETIILALSQGSIVRRNWRTKRPAGSDLEIPSNFDRISALTMDRDVIVAGSNNGEIVVWEGESTLGERRGSLNQQVTALFLSDDFIVAGGIWGELMLWDRRQIDKAPRLLTTSSVVSVAGITAGHALLVGKDRLILLDWRTGETFERSVNLDRRGPAAIGGELVVYSDARGILRRWRIGSTHEDAFVGQDFRGRFCAVAASTIVTVMQDGTIRLWDTEMDAPIPLRDPGHEVALDEDSITCAAVLDKELISGGRDGVLRRWNSETGAAIATRIASQEEITSVVAGGALILSGSSDGTISVWDSFLKPIGKPLDLEDGVVSMAMEDHRFAAGGERGRLKLFDLNMHRTLRDFECSGEPIAGLALSENSLTYCSGHEIGRWTWRPGETGARLQRIFASDDTAEFRSLAVRGRLIVCGFDDEETRIWNLRPDGADRNSDGKILGGSGASAIAIAKNVVIAGGWEGIVWFWDIVTRNLVCQIHAGSPVRSLAVRGKSVFVACRAGLLRVDLPTILG